MTETPAQMIDAKIAGLGDWRGDVLAHVRKVIHAAGPDVTETVKWQKPTNPSGVPVWEHAGIICTGETYKNYVKLTFAQGASLADPEGVFNASLTGGTRRAIDIREGDTLNENALTALVQEAAALNAAKKKKPRG